MNEVEIRVTAEDDTDAGFRSARTRSEGFANGLKKLFTSAGGDSATGFGLNFSQRVGPLIAKAPIGAPMATAVAAAGPAIASALVTSITVGAGLGATALGATISAKDPRVAAGIANLKTFIGSELQKSTTPFVPAMLESIEDAKVGFRSIRPELDAIFSKSSTYLDPLTDGAIAFVRNALPGFRSLVDAAEPFVHILGDELPELGEDLAALLESIAESAGRNEEEFRAILDTVGLVVQQIQMAVDLMDYLGSGPTRMFLDLLYEAEEVIPGAKWVEPLDDVARGFKEATERAREYEDAIRAQTDPTFAMIDAQRQLRSAQDEYNEALRKHGHNSTEAREALLEVARASIRAQVAAQGLAGTTDGRLTPSMRATLRAAGLTAAEINRVEREFIQAKAAGDRFAKTYTANVVTKFRTEGRAVPIYDVPQSGIGGRAHGGVVGSAQNGGTRAGLTMVGEYGREIVDLPPGAQVHSNADTERMMAGGMGGFSGGVLEVRPAPGADQELMGVIIKNLRFSVRTEGQGNADTFFAGG